MRMAADGLDRDVIFDKLISKTLMTVTFRPHKVAMSSGSDVRTVTGPGAAKAVALSIASIACR